MLPGADEGTRTPNLLITNQLLYQLSYVSMVAYFPQSCRIIEAVPTVNAPNHGHLADLGP